MAGNSWKQNLQDLWSRITSTRAGNLDYLRFIVLAAGTLTTSSTTVPADNVGRTEADHYWDGCILLPTSGTVAWQPRVINSFANAGGVFTLDRAFTAASGTVSYWIIGRQDWAGVTALTSTRVGYLDALNTGVPVNSRTAAFSRLVGTPQSISVHITSAANAGDVVVATVTTQPCYIKSLVVRSNGATTANLTSAAIFGGAGKVVTFIDAATGIRANIAVADQQVAWTGAVSLAATKTIVITLAGTGAGAVDLQVDIEYFAIADGGYLA